MRPIPLVLLAVAAMLADSATRDDAVAQEADKAQVIVITVRLPADAVLMIDEHAMQLTGGERVFQTPPVPVGWHYAYVLKAKSQGKEVTRQIFLAHGTDNTVDLRAEFLGAAKSTVPAKTFISSAPKGMPAHIPTLNWGMSLRTLEEALDLAPSDGSRFPKQSISK